MTLKLLSCSLLLLILCAYFALPQAPSPVEVSKEEKEKTQKEVERKSLVLLDETLENGQGLKLVENRALLQAQAADLLWTRDEKRSRNLFRGALADVGQSLAGMIEQGQRNEQGFWNLMQFRSQTILIIARRDPQLALDLLYATRPVLPEGATRDFGMPNQELALEQNIATQVVESDPKRALKMAQESLARGISFGVSNLLRRLQEKDGEAATRLATDIVAKLRTENFTKNQEASFVAVDLLRSVLLPSHGDPVGQSLDKSAVKSKPLVLDDPTIRDLAETVINASLNLSPNNPGLLMQLQPMLSDLEKLVPERAAQLRPRVAETIRTLNPEYKAWSQMEPLMRNGSAEEILEAAAKAPPENSRALYSFAASKLLQGGDFDRARQIVSEHLRGPERDVMLAQIDRLAVARTLEQGKLDEAKQIISRLPSREMKAGAFAELALGVMKLKADRKLALQLLGEARNLISSPPENDRQVAALLQVARAYAVVEPAQTFELLNPLIDQANEMLAAAALLEKFGQGQGIFKKGEIILQSSVSVTQGSYGQYLTELGTLARADFDRTKALADRFQRNEIRLIARLIIAQSVLSDHLPPANGPNGAFLVGGSSITVINY
jgi:tetratricopeptide (TPR) repeat protein